MKYEVKGLTSYGVYDGDRLLTTYENEKTATLVAEALNEEAGRVDEAVLSAYRSVEPERVPGVDHTPRPPLGAKASDPAWCLGNAASNPDRVQAQADLNASYTTLEEITLTNGHAPQETD
ncbi:hypothetical protein [Hyphomonas sp.]|uniref:hypothetical protein n=1 Tax=Hyphomonas sp. TaxID=87 RepID=UPI003001150C